MKTLSNFTGTTNLLINGFIALTVIFVAVTLVAVAVHAFGDLTLLNRSF